MTAPHPWPTGRLCPATSNLPTRMLPASWRTLCAAMQRREVVGADRGKSGMAPEDFAAISAVRFPCAMCGGRMLPPGLELITQEEASEMARQTKRGICELCGSHTNVGMNHGSKACPACTHVQTALNKRPEAAAKAIRAMHKTEEMLGHLIPAGGLAVKVTADLLQEISGLVGYEGEDPAELVAAVRLRVRTCASCDSEDVLHEIREVVGYSPGMGDSGLADAVRALIVTPGTSPDCADCTTLRGDLLRACGMEMDDTEDGEGWDVAAAAAIQEIAQLEYRRDFWASKATKIKIEAGDLRSELLVKRGEIAELSAKLQEALAANDSLSGEIYRAKDAIAKLRAELTLVEQAHAEWEQRAVHAEQTVETLEAEMRKLESSLVPCTDNTLLDIALKALRGEGPDADQLATLIDAARRVA